MNLSRYYRFLYRVGFTPWEEDADGLAPQLGALLAREEAGRAPPYGRALDLGCGSGRWSVELAGRGWQVTGIDVVPAAVAAARRRAQAADLDVCFVEGDVTALRRAGVDGVGSSFSFFLDIECFNHLSDSQRLAMGTEVDAVAAADASMLLLAWARARRGPLPAGAEAADLRKAFPGWRVVGDEPYAAALPLPLRNVAPRWYRLARG